MTDRLKDYQSTLSNLNQDLDWTHLVEELEDLSKRQRRELLNRLRVLLMHLLKWQYQSTELPYRGQSWLSTREHTDYFTYLESINRHDRSSFQDFKLPCKALR